MGTRLACGVFLAVTVLSQSARAQQCKNPAASARSCILSDGSINLVVNVRTPPLPAQVQFIEEQFRRTSKMMCDYTDGQIRLGQVTLTHTDANQKDADVWWYAQGGRGHSGFGLDKTNFAVFGFGIESNPCPRACDSTLAIGDPNGCDADSNATTFDGCDRTLPTGAKYACDGCGNVGERVNTGANALTMAHELGHLILEIGDQYEEQTLGGDGCGHGPSFDGPAGGLWTTRTGPVAMTAAQLLAADAAGNVERNHTIMQELGGQVCRDTTKSSFGYFDLFPDFADRGEFPCNVDADCTDKTNGGYGLGPNFKCSLPLLDTEISVTPNYDPLRGTGFTTPNAIANCAAAYAGTTFSTREIAFGGRVLQGTAGLCGNGAVDTGEQCDSSAGGGSTTPCTTINTTIGGNFTSGTATCGANCLWSLSSCVGPAPKDSCTGNTVTDAGEQCQPGQTNTCTAVRGTVVNGNTTCGANCAWNLSTCANPTITCGNGVIDGPLLGFGGEQCDGAALGTATCSSQGFSGSTGTLKCLPNCHFDYSGCTRAPVGAPLCGNGTLDANEECDASSTGALPPCSNFGAGRTGTVSCGANCALDLSKCAPLELKLDTTTFNSAWRSPGFGYQETDVFDGIGQAYEKDSKHAVWSFTAASSNPGAWQVVLATNRDDYTSNCGNGTVDAGEDCDGGTSACTAFAGGVWGSGTATCASNCKWDKSSCSTAAAATCGDGTVQAGEDCDGAGKSCQDLGMEGPDKLACRGNCSLDTTACKQAQFLELGRYNIVFDGSGNVTQVNGNAYPANHPSIQLGGTTAPAPYGTLPGGAPGGQTAATGAFKVAGHPQVNLTVFFDDLHRTATVPTFDGTRDFFQRISLRSRFGTVAGQGDVPARGTCNDDFSCQFSWNSTSQRFESSGGTIDQLWDAKNSGVDVSINPSGQIVGEWTLAAAHLARWNLDKFDTYIGADRPLVDIKPGASCPDPTFNDVDVKAPQQVVIVLDRSGSMSQEDAGGLGVRQRRLDFVKAAARNFVDLFSDSTRPATEFPSIGLVWFNQDQFTAFGSPGNLRKLVRGNCGSAANPCADPNEIGNEYIKSEFLRDKEDPAGENPTPEGLTSIGAAIRTGGSFFSEAKGATQAVLLLSDGENNPPSGVTDDPLAEADTLLKDPTKNVQFYTVPAIDGDHTLSTELARRSNGEMLPVDEVDQVMPRFMDAFARQRGEALTLDRVPVAVQREVCGGEFCNHLPAGVTTSQDIVIPVEAEAKRLNVLLSTRNGDPRAIGNPRIELKDPNGNVVATETSSAARNDAFYRAVSLVAPMKGNWKLSVLATNAATTQYSFVTAHVEDPSPDCFVSVTPPLVHDATQFEVQATALWGRAIRTGVTFTGSILQPDKTTIPLSFAWSAARDKFIATVPTTALTAGKGGYEVRLTCNVTDAAEFVDGEDPFHRFPAAPKNAVHAFQRAASSWFHFDSSQPTTLKPGGDADGDGILDADEPAGDFDHDGLDDPWDSDADNDDVPDGSDPDPHDPNVPRFHNGQCQTDTTPPTINAPDTTFTQCMPSAVDRAIPATATDASCFGNGFVTLTGQLVSVHGTTLSTPVPIDGTNPRATLPPGTSVIQWTARDVNGNTSFATQTITVTTADTAVACCSPGQTVVNGTNFVDVFVLLANGPYCVFGNGAPDAIVTGLGADLLSGGDGIDTLTTGSAGDVCIGGAGDDVITLPIGQGKAYGGDGNDVIEVTGAGTIEGNAGDDVIVGVSGDHLIYPGPGRDTVHAGIDNDTVIVRDPCELAALEVLDGGLGNDTLYTPVPVATLLSMGVVVLNFENIVVTTAYQSASECL